MRFKRSPSQILGSKLFSRRDVNPRLTVDRAMDRGQFLGRLWTHFGPALARDGGFEFYLRDKETNLDVVAYAGPRGCAYAGDPQNRDALKKALEALEYILDGTRPVDCAIEYNAPLEYGGGKWVLGVKDGRSFDVPDRRNRKTPSVVERRAHR